MPVLFRLETVPECEDPYVGYAWLEVLAITQTGTRLPSEDDAKFYDRMVSNTYLCNSEQGLVTVGEEDIHTAIEKGSTAWRERPHS
jgi:hypothetical protein